MKTKKCFFFFHLALFLFAQQTTPFPSAAPVVTPAPTWTPANAGGYTQISMLKNKVISSTLTNSNNSNFGADMAGLTTLSGSQITIIGANGLSSGQGAAYIFTRSMDSPSSLWSQQQQLLVPPVVGGNIGFGVSTAIANTTIAVGANFYFGTLFQL